MEADGSRGVGFESLRANLELEVAAAQGHRAARARPRQPRVHVALEAEVATTGRTCRGASPRSVARNPPRTRRRRCSRSATSASATALCASTTRVRGITHELSELGVGVPFVSNPPVRVDVFVQPSLSANQRRRAAAQCAHQALRRIARNHPRRLAEGVRPHALDRLPADRCRLPPSFGAADDQSRALVQPDGGGCASVLLRGPLQVHPTGAAGSRARQSRPRTRWELGIRRRAADDRRWHFTWLRPARPELDLVRLKDGGLNVLADIASAAEGARKAKGKGCERARPPRRSRRRRLPDLPRVQPRQTQASPRQPPRRTARRWPMPATQPGRGGFPARAHARIRDGWCASRTAAWPSPFRARIEAINLDMRDLATEGELPGRDPPRLRHRCRRKFTHEDVPPGALRVLGRPAVRVDPPAALCAPPGGGDARRLSIGEGSLSGGAQYRVTLGGRRAGGAGQRRGARTARFALLLKGCEDAALSLPALDVHATPRSPRRAAVRIGGVESGAAVSAVRKGWRVRPR